MGYKQISVKKKIVCSGDLKHKIEIGSRSLGAGNTGLPIHVFTVLKTVYSMIDTIEPDDNFDSISIDTDSVTHVFYIRHLKDLDINIKHVIRFNGNYYRILKSMNSEEMGIIDIIYTAHKGSILKAGSDW